MKRVVITGLGITCGIGNDIHTFSENLACMKSGILPFSIFDSGKYTVKIGSTVHGLEKKLSPRILNLPRPLQFLWNATQDALTQSGIMDSINPQRIGTYVAGPACSLLEVENYYRTYVNQGLAATQRHDLTYANWDSAVNEISRQFSIMGPRNTILTACSSSGVAIGLATDLIRLGEVDAMIAAGTDGFSEFTFSGFQSLNSISPVPCRPFDQDRAGLSFGEGAGVLVLEDYDRAVKRGAVILAEIAGYGAVGEGYNLTAPHPEAIGFIKTMNRAMKMAQVCPDEISYINAHGTATPINDAVEGYAIRKLFGDRDLPVNSIKSLVGHCMGAAGAVEAVNTVLTLMHNMIPGTLNCTTPDQNIPITVVQNTIERQLNYALCNSAGFGGNNSSVLFKRFA
ncbi:MAG: beta-ketoacyl synthase [Bdellovibrionales bacterium]